MQIADDFTPRSHRYRQRTLALLAVLVAAAGVSACGGSGHTTPATSPTTNTTTSTATTQTTPTTSTSSGSNTGGAAVTTGPVRGSLHGQNHTPKVGKPWSYSVKVTSAAGKPLSGTVTIEFVYGGQVVGHDTPPTHPVTAGKWHDQLKFPSQAVGFPLSFQAVVHTHAGSITLDWPVTVSQH